MTDFYSSIDPEINRAILDIARAMSGNRLTVIPDSVRTAPIPASNPSPKIKANQTTNTSAIDSNGGGNRGGQADPNAGPNDPGSMRDGKSDKGVLDGLATFGMNALAFTSPMGVVNAMKGAIDPQNPSLSLRGMLADALGIGGDTGFDSPGFSPEGMAAMGFSANMDGAHGYDGESGGSSGGTFGDWGGSQGVDWGGDPDGFGGSSGTAQTGSDGGEGNSNSDGGGASASDGEGGTGWAAGGLVRGPGTGKSDSIKGQSLSNGEFVMPADVTKEFLPLLEYMRRTGKLPTL